MKKLWLLIYILLISFPLFFTLAKDQTISVIGIEINDNQLSKLILINEVMSSNQSAHQDIQGDFSDWIELYNPNIYAVNLGGFKISDRYENLNRYELPANTMIEPKGFLVIYASGKDGVFNNQIHTNFAINQLGEPLILSNKDGTLVDYLKATRIPSDMSYGRFPDGSDSWVYFKDDQTTPGSSNNLSTFEILPIYLNPDFSHQGGFYTESFHLSLNSRPGTTIYYTLDGSDPTENDMVYEEPLFIEKQLIAATGQEIIISRSLDESYIPPVPQEPLSMIRTGSKNWKSPTGDIFKATVIKARAYDVEGRTSEVVTHTYFVDPNMNEKYTFPIISISTDINHLFSYETGINVPGVHYDPTIDENNNNRTGNYFQRGSDWERPIFIEYFEQDGSRAFAQNAGIRIHGGLSRKYPIKSYRLYARSDYDPVQNSFNYQFFKDKDIDNHKRLILRGAGQAYQYTFMGEAAAHALLQPLSLDIQYNQPIILFINGEYFGIRNLRDRLDEWYLSIHYGGDRENFTLLTGFAYYDSGSIEGQSHYLDLYRTITRNNMSSSYYYDHVSTRMDLDNFRDYYISQIFMGNADWPQNNITYWRYNVSSYDPEAPYGLDGKWRWLVYDLDAGFAASWGGNTPEVDTFSRLVGADWRTGNMYTALLANESFKNGFINRFADLLNTHFHQDVATQLVSDYIDLYEPEMREHIRRWGYPSSYTSWESYVNKMLVFAAERPENIRLQLLEHFDLKSVKELTVHTDLDMGTVRVNTIELDASQMDLGYFSGLYFEGAPVKLTALPKEGHRFIGWYNQLDQLVSLSSEQEVSLNGNTIITARFEEGEPFPIDGEQPLISESVLLYTSLFVLSTIAVIGFLANEKRKKSSII